MNTEAHPWPYLAPLRLERIDWKCWWGRSHRADSTWLTDGTMAFRRTAIVDASRAAKLDASDVSPEAERRGMASGASVLRYVSSIPLDRSYAAEWLGSWKRPAERRYVTLGDPGLATYDVSRIRFAHLLVEFDEARWVPFRSDATGDPFPLVLFREAQIVGVVSPIRIRDVKVPIEIMEAARKRWPL